MVVIAVHRNKIFILGELFFCFSAHIVIRFYRINPIAAV